MSGEKPANLKPAREVMPARTAALFEEIRKNPLLNPFILIGGTALSLHIGHRVSEDLDFITLLRNLPRKALENLERELEERGHHIFHDINPAAHDDFQNAGMELEDSQQNWIVDGSVKLTFFSADLQHEKLLARSARNEPAGAGFKIAAFHELCQLKATVTASRSKSRDWLDLFILERDHGFGLAQWKDAFDQAGLTPAHFEIALNRLCKGNPEDREEGYTALLPNPPTILEMQTRFQKLRHRYETALAKDMLD